MKRLIFAALILAVTAPVIAGGLFSSEPPKPILLEASTDRVATLKQLVDNDSALRNIPQAKSGTKTVALGKVHITVATATSAGASKKSFGTGSVSQVSMDYKLLGVTAENVQAIADKFYVDLKNALTSQGYEVLSPEKLLVDADFKEVISNTKSPEVDSDYIAATAKNTGVPTGLLQNVKFTNLSKTLGDIPVLDVDMTLSFAEFKDTSSSREVSLKANTRLAIQQGHINVFFAAPSFGVGSSHLNILPFKRIIALPGDIAESVVDKGSSATDMALSVLSVIGGGRSSGKTLEITVVKNYREVVSANLQPFAEVIANVLPQPTKAQ